MQTTHRFLALAIVPWLSQSLIAEEIPTKITAGHNLLSENHAGESTAISTVESFSFHDVEGSAWYSDDILSNGPAAFVFLSTKCPLAKRYTMRLNRLHEQFEDDGVTLFAVFPNSDEDIDGISSYCKLAKFKFPAVLDRQNYLVNRFQATMTPQVFLIDQFSRIRYRGAIDDNRYENRVKESYLLNAMTALVNGKPVLVPQTESMGCRIHAAESTGAGDVTYSSHIARILQDNCRSCHRDGQVAPFALTNFEEAHRWREEIKAYTQSRLMPPWKANSEFASYKNDVSLTSEEIALISTWVDAGAPLGDVSQIPPSPRFNDGWAFGEPDLIVEMPEQYVVGPEGEDDYRHFIIPFKADKHRFVKAVDVQPGNRNVVHHVIAYVDTSGEARKLDAADEGPGYSRFGDVGFQPASVIGGWAPGNDPAKTPAGTGRWLPKECDIVLQVHYYRTGIEERDQTKVGIYFAAEQDPVPTRGGVVINKEFVVPPNESDFEVTAELTIEESSYLYNVTPHMHLIGETMVVTAHRPDGSVVPVVKIDDWDFNWQNTYFFKNFEHLPKGTVVKLRATFDNSERNPNNPNSPPAEIGWGEKTTDEMCIAFLGLLHEAEYDPLTEGRRKAEEQVEKSLSAR